MSSFTNSLTVNAPAKVNYRLDVLSRRPNGYHDLHMIMQPVGLFDLVTVTLTETVGITVCCEHVAVPEGADNIVYRAAEAMRERAGRHDGVTITIQKSIPVAAGMGGGSSDCAAVITALDQLYGLSLSCEELMAIGLRFGADVPFFLYGGTARAEGIGEVLSPVTVSCPVWMVLVNPMVPVSTAWVYQNFKLTQTGSNVTIPDSIEGLEELCSFLANDLERVTIPAFPVVGQIKQQLLDAGAYGALMSGSGPTVFGVFPDQAAAQAAAEQIRVCDAGWFVTVAPAIESWGNAAVTTD